MKYAYVFVTCLLLLSSCKNNEGTTDPTFGNRVFQGITQTSDGPTPTGSIDPDDWSNDGYWNTKYPVALCPQAGIAKQSPSAVDLVFHPNGVPTSYKCYPAYPNPCSGGAAFTVDLPQRSFVNVAIIDDHYRVVVPLVCDAPCPAGQIVVLWNGTGIGTQGVNLPGGIYRVLILVTNQEGGMLFASHGDVLVK